MSGDRRGSVNPTRSKTKSWDGLPVRWTDLGRFVTHRWVAEMDGHRSGSGRSTESRLQAHSPTPARSPGAPAPGRDQRRGVEVSETVGEQLSLPRSPRRVDDRRPAPGIQCVHEGRRQMAGVGGSRCRHTLRRSRGTPRRVLQRVVSSPAHSPRRGNTWDFRSLPARTRWISSTLNCAGNGVPVHADRGGGGSLPTARQCSRWTAQRTSVSLPKPRSPGARSGSATGFHS